MEEPHLWDDDLCCQLSAIQLDVKSVLQDGPSCYESCIISFQSRSACKRITMASKRQNSLYKESRLLLLLSSTRGSTDSRSGLSTKMNLQGSACPTGCVDPCWCIPCACGDCSQRWSRCAWNASWSPLVFGSSRPWCSRCEQSSQPFLVPSDCVDDDKPFLQQQYVSKKKLLYKWDAVAQTCTAGGWDIF